MCLFHARVQIVDERGNQWAHDVLTPGMWIHVHMLLQRGGMRTQDLTPTEPYEGVQQDQQQREPQHDREEPLPVVRGRSQESSRSRSPMSSLYRASASPTRHAWHSEAIPDPISMAQHDPTPRVVLDRHFPVGYVWANPRASLREVRRTMRMDLHVGVDISMEPQEARMWAEVERVRIGPPYPIDLFLYADLRLTRWELYAEPRGILVMHKGEIEKYIVVPWNLIMQVAQSRVDLWAERVYTYQTVALDEDNWVILKRLQPDRVREALTAYEEVVRHHIERGGMRRQVEVTNDHHNVGAWDRNTYLIVWVEDIAHTHTYSFAPYVVHRRVSVWRFRRYMAELYGVDEMQVVLSTHNSIFQGWFSAVPFWSLDVTFFCIVGCFLWGSAEHLFPHLLIHRCSILAPTHLGGSLLATCVCPQHNKGNPRWFKFLVFECPKRGLCNRGSVLHPYLIP